MARVTSRLIILTLQRRTDISNSPLPVPPTSSPWPLFLKFLSFQRRVDLELGQLPLFVELAVDGAGDAVRQQDAVFGAVLRKVDFNVGHRRWLIDLSSGLRF